MARAKRVVLVEGIEPTRPCGHRILSPARLPVPPHQLRWVAYHGGWGGLKGGSIKLLGRAERFYRRDAEDAEKTPYGMYQVWVWALASNLADSTMARKTRPRPMTCSPE